MRNRAYSLSSFNPAKLSESSKFSIGPSTIGDGSFTVFAGPCSIESYDQFLDVARFVGTHGVGVLRGGVYKLRTDPNSFQGLGEKSFEIVQRVRAETGMPIVTEITDPRQLESLHDLVDMFQVGTRNMYNYDLLKELGTIRKPVLLKRAFSALVKEWLLAAEYVLKGGNSEVILCERGIRTFETSQRNTLDLGSIAYIKKHSHLPVIADPSHGTGRRDLVEPMTLAAAAAGADGVMIEVHPNPEKAFSDGDQAVNYAEFAQIMARLNRLLPALDRHLALPHATVPANSAPEHTL